MAKQKTTNGKGFEETLWETANKLRGSVASSEYKHVVLSLIFQKFSSDKFEDRRKELIAEGKEKGLVVDYIGIKSQKNKALAQFSKSAETNFEEIDYSIIAVKDHLNLLNRMFHKFDRNPYFHGTP